MTQSVWKFPLKVDDEQSISIPAGFTPLKVDVQQGVPCLWALVNPAVEKTDVVVRIYGTGHPIDDFVRGDQYVDSFMMYDGQLVFHVFLFTQERNDA